MWPKTPRLPPWPRDVNSLDTPGSACLIAVVSGWTSEEQLRCSQTVQQKESSETKQVYNATHCESLWEVTSHTASVSSHLTTPPRNAKTIPKSSCSYIWGTILGPSTFANVTPCVWNTLAFSCLLEEFLNYLFNPSPSVTSFKKTSLTPPAWVRLLDPSTVDILSQNSVLWEVWLSHTS